MGMGKRSHLLLLGEGGLGSSMPGVIKEKSPAFRSPEVGISEYVLYLFIATQAA